MSAHSLAIIALLAPVCLLGQGASKTFAQDAPWGLAWGPLKDVPRPSFAQRESNITALIYLQDRVPPDLRDTEEIVLEVCVGEGLQHIVWVSRRLSDADADAQYAAALAEGTRRYGAAGNGLVKNSVEWRTARTTLRLTQKEAGLRRVVMTSVGPDFEACSKRHADLTGHPATEHIAELIAGP